MIKYIFTYLLIVSNFLFTQSYSIGDTLSITDQLTRFETCYGDYPSDSLSLADFSGELNGGNYGITFISLHSVA